MVSRDAVKSPTTPDFWPDLGLSYVALLDLGRLCGFGCSGLCSWRLLWVGILTVRGILMV